MAVCGTTTYFSPQPRTLPHDFIDRVDLVFYMQFQIFDHLVIDNFILTKYAYYIKLVSYSTQCFT